MDSWFRRGRDMKMVLRVHFVGTIQDITERKKAEIRIKNCSTSLQISLVMSLQEGLLMA